jgi:hypothetical protein
MAQKWNTGTGKSKVMASKSGQTPMTGKTPPLKPFGKNPEGNKNGNKRQAPTVTVTSS